MWSRLSVIVVIGVLFCGAGTAAGASPGVERAASRSVFYPIADLSAQRLAAGDLVAAAKWGTDSPIDDPAREKQVLDAVGERARQVGADPQRTREIFRDQIEANKVVQRGLYRRWTADPDTAPDVRPDLNDVRQEINRINEALVLAIAVSAPDRSAPLCPAELGVSVVRVYRQRQLDRLHAGALARSVGSVCDELTPQ